jgi:hypothetical protein
MANDGGEVELGALDGATNQVRPEVGDDRLYFG